MQIEGSVTVTPADIDRARTLLAERGMADLIKPRRFATAARQLGQSLTDVLELIMALQMGTQGRGPAPIAEAIAMKQGGRS